MAEIKMPCALLISDQKIVIFTIPFSRGENSFRELKNQFGFFCSLKRSVVDKLNSEQTRSLRNDLEVLASSCSTVPLELGYAEYAIDKYGEEVVLCYFGQRQHYE